MKLSTVKKHLLVDTSFTDDDSYIQELMDVAEASVEAHLDIALTALEGDDGSIPSPLISAMMLMVGNLYANREPVAVGVSVAEMPLSYRYLVGLYQRYNIG